jgi:hypothetical protein
MTLLSGVYDNGGWGVRGNLHKFKHNSRNNFTVFSYPENDAVE